MDSLSLRSLLDKYASDGGSSCIDERSSNMYRCLFTHDDPESANIAKNHCSRMMDAITARCSQVKEMSDEYRQLRLLWSYLGSLYSVTRRIGDDDLTPDYLASMIQSMKHHLGNCTIAGDADYFTESIEVCRQKLALARSCALEGNDVIR